MAAAGSRSGSGRSEVFVTKTWERDVADDRPIDVGGEGSSLSKPIFVICDTECGNHTSIVTCVIKVKLPDEIPFASPDVRRPLRHPVVSSQVDRLFVKKINSGRRAPQSAMTSVGNEPLVKIKEYPTLVMLRFINPSLLAQLSLRDENRKANTSLHHIDSARGRFSQEPFGQDIAVRSLLYAWALHSSRCRDEPFLS